MGDKTKEAVLEVADKLQKEGKSALQDIGKAAHYQAEAVQAAAKPAGDKAKEGLMVGDPHFPPAHVKLH